MSAALPDWNTSIRCEREITRSVENIVLALDDTVNSRSAIPVVRRLSELYHATIHVTYVGEGALDWNEAAARLGLRADEEHGIIFEPGQADRIAAVTALAIQLPNALIVMSTDAGRTTDKDHFGSVTESVFASKPKRALLLPLNGGNKPWRLRRILLAHDGTPTCHAATASAAELAHRAGAQVIALHVAARGEERSAEPGSIPAPLYVDQPQHEWPTWAEEFMNRITGSAPPWSVQLELVVTGGQAGSEVAKVARERGVDLVVMAWHGHWERESCATRVVVRNSDCPVLLVYSAD